MVYVKDSSRNKSRKKLRKTTRVRKTEKSSSIKQLSYLPLDEILSGFRCSFSCSDRKSSSFNCGTEMLAKDSQCKKIINLDDPLVESDLNVVSPQNSKNVTQKVPSKIALNHPIYTIQDVVSYCSKLGFARNESECIYYFMQGMTTKQIGKALKISHRTVEFYLNNAKARLCFEKDSVS